MKSMKKFIHLWLKKWNVGSLAIDRKWRIIEKFWHFQKKPLHYTIWHHYHCIKASLGETCRPLIWIMLRVKKLCEFTISTGTWCHWQKKNFKVDNIFITFLSTIKPLSSSINHFETHSCLSDIILWFIQTFNFFSFGRAFKVGVHHWA